MSAFVRNKNEQSLSPRAGQVSVEFSEIESGTPIKVNFWRWQFWNERGNGEWDSIYLSPGEARELAYGILEQLGKRSENGKAEKPDNHQGSPGGGNPSRSGASAPATVDASAGNQLPGISVSDNG